MEEHKAEGTSTQESLNGASVATYPHKKGNLINTLYPPGPRPGVGPRMKNHCRKFWWCDCIVTIVIVLVTILPIMLVGIPHKAQHDINASTLEVNSQNVSDPTPNSVHIKIQSTARSSSSYHPKIDSFNASLSLEGQKPFLYLQVPKTKAEKETPITIDQNANIVDMDSFIEYNKVVMDNETFDVKLSGKTKVHLSGLRPISVHYTKKITMKGLNKLSGLQINNLKILSGANEMLSDGSNMIGNVLIPNPSVMTLDLGNVTMNLSINNQSIGYSLIPNLILKPGMNNFSMQSTVDQISVFELVTTKYKDAILPVDIVGNSSIMNGVHLPYFEAAIKSNTIRVNLDAGPALSAIGLFNATNGST